jgi:NTP pyrophosphatase (non-canonical NTP hydrolase)
MKTFEEYERLAALTAPEGVDAAAHGFTGMVSELGEIADARKRVLAYDLPLDPIHMLEEAGDVLWYLQRFLTGYGYGLEDAARANIAKLALRSERLRAAPELRNLKLERAVLENAASA